MLITVALGGNIDGVQLCQDRRGDCLAGYVVEKLHVSPTTLCPGIISPTADVLALNDGNNAFGPVLAPGGMPRNPIHAVPQQLKGMRQEDWGGSNILDKGFTGYLDV